MAQGIVDAQSVRDYNLQFAATELPKLHNGDCDLVNVYLTKETYTADAFKLIVSFIKSTFVGYVAAINCAGLAVGGGPFPKKNAMYALIRISNILKDATKLTTLNLSDNHLGDKGLRMLEDMFDRNTLKHVNVSNTGLHGDDIKTLKGYLGKSRLSLTHVSISNNTCLGPKGAKNFGSFLSTCRLPKLVHVELGNVGAAEGSPFLINGLYKLLEEGNRLEYVNLKGFELNKTNRDAFLDFIEKLARVRFLKYLDVSNSGMNAEDQDHVREYLLNNNTELVIGDYDGNGVTEESQFVELSMRG